MGRLPAGVRSGSLAEWGWCHPCGSGGRGWVEAGRELPPLALRFVLRLPGNPRSVGQEAKPRSVARRALDPVSGKRRSSRRGRERLGPARRHLPPGGRQPTHPPRERRPLGPAWGAPWRPRGGQHAGSRWLSSPGRFQTY